MKVFFLICFLFSLLLKYRYNIWNFYTEFGNKFLLIFWMMSLVVPGSYLMKQLYSCFETLARHSRHSFQRKQHLSGKNYISRKFYSVIIVSRKILWDLSFTGWCLEWSQSSMEHVKTVFLLFKDEDFNSNTNEWAPKISLIRFTWKSTQTFQNCQLCWTLIYCR